MVANLVAFPNVTPQQTDVVLRLLTDHHECCFYLLGLQDVENLRRPRGVGTIVEAERNLVRMVAVVLDGVRLRIGLHVLIGRGLVLCIHVDGARPRMRHGSDAQDVAVTVRIDVIAGRYF